MDIPDDVPSRIYLRLAVFDWQRSGKHRLIGQTGGTVEQLQPDRAGRGLPLPLVMPGGGAPSRGGALGCAPGASGRGTLWVEKCELW